MLRINTTNNYIYLTKGDSGNFTITLNNYTYKEGDKLQFNVRNARNLDNIRFTLDQSDDEETTDVGEISVTDNIRQPGNIRHSGNNTWQVFFKPEATTDLKRGNYVYDIKLLQGEEITTFVGGDTEKLYFVVT